ncbi:hypothetical protein [Pseudonocardia sp. ICBG162]|uniref:hypothetical protein n=1 Tax=Pseudonocardia sp. ICBG162 TaxID=2846761 RepID=UPI001CF69F2A|nr:hypothetical protein [Pseudonocardia sp. ICBG162]
MGYSPPFERLHAMTDDELRRTYDGAAENTVVGTGFYLDELNRRAFARAGESAQRLARINAAVAILAVVIAIVAIAVPLLAQPPEVQPCTVLVGTEHRPALCLVGPFARPSR